MGPVILLLFSSVQRELLRGLMWFPPQLGGMKLVTGWMFCFSWGLHFHVEELYLAFIFLVNLFCFYLSW